MRFVSFIVSSCFKSCVTTHGSLLKELLQVCVCNFLQAVHNKAAIASRFIVSVVSINSFNGLKVSEIALEFGLSERAVEGRLRRARLRLRKKLESVVGTRGGVS